MVSSMSDVGHLIGVGPAHRSLCQRRAKTDNDEHARHCQFSRSVDSLPGQVASAVLPPPCRAGGPVAQK